jgi:hypothetical protein
MITISQRPIRVAFLVPPDDKDMFLKCVRINSSLWGGASNVLLPYQEIMNNDDFWTKILLYFDPDNIVVADNCTDFEINRLKERYDVFHVEKMSNCFELGFFKTIHFGTHTYSLFLNQNFHITKERRKDVLYFNLNTEESKEDLRYALTFGLMNVDYSLSAKHSYLEGVQYDFFNKIVEIHGPDATPLRFLDYYFDWITGKLISIFDHTMISDERFSRRTVYPASGNVSKYPLIILTSGSLLDYLLAASLRHWIVFSYFPIPIIMNINSQTIVEETDKITRFLKKENIPVVNLFSLTCIDGEVDNFIKKVNLRCRKLNLKEILIYCEQRVDFCYRVTEQCILNKDVDILLRKSNLFFSLGNYDYFMGELAFSNYAIPYKRNLNEKDWSNKKLFSGGIKTLCSGNEDETIHLMLPEADDILYTLMVKKEIWPFETPLRKTMKAVIDYFDNFWELAIFSAKEIQNLYFELKSPSGSKKSEIIALEYGEMCKVMNNVPFQNKFPKKLKAYFISELIKKGVLFRGAEISCPNCYLKEWKLLNELQNKNVCSGCGKENNFGDIHDTPWEYRLNKLFAEGFDLTVFLTLMRTIGFKHQDLDKVVGYNFGFRADFSKNSELISIMKGKTEIEVDIAVIENGRITIGECKQNPIDFTDKIVRDVLEFSKYINCDRVIFSSIGDLSHLREHVSTLNLDGYPEVEVLGEKELLYLTAHLQGELDRARAYDLKKYEDLKDTSKRRHLFMDQLLMIEKNRSNPSKVIGNYFDV